MKRFLDFGAFQLSQALMNSHWIRHRVGQHLTHCFVIPGERRAAVGEESEAAFKTLHTKIACIAPGHLAQRGSQPLRVTVQCCRLSRC